MGAVTNATNYPIHADLRVLVYRDKGFFDWFSNPHDNFLLLYKTGVGFIQQGFQFGADFVKWRIIAACTVFQPHEAVI